MTPDYMHWQLAPDGTLIPSPPIPQALFYGEGVYTSFCLPLESQWQQAHWTRLLHDAHCLHIDSSAYHSIDLETLMHTLQAQFSDSTSSLWRLTMTPQISGWQDLLTPTPNAGLLLISGKPFQPTLELSPPLALKSVAQPQPFPGIKHTALSESFYWKRQAIQEGYQDFCWADHRQLIEASTSNLFAIQHNTLITPPLSSGCLPGITRQRILSNSKIHNTPYQERSILHTDIPYFDGMFLCNAVRGIIPISRVNQHAIHWQAEATELLQKINLSLQDAARHGNFPNVLQ